MKEKFNNLFIRSNNVINWLESPGYLGMKKVGNIITLMFVLVGIFISLFEDMSRALTNVLVGLLMMNLYTLFFMLSLRFYWIKPPKFIRKSTENPAQLFNIFSHWSYLYGVFIFSFFASIFIEAVLFALLHVMFSVKINIGSIFYNLFFITTAIYSVLFFMYHVTVKNISTKVIKARIRMYLAIIATITAGLFGFATKEVLTPLITCLGVGYAWLTYFIEKIDSES